MDNTKIKLKTFTVPPPTTAPKSWGVADDDRSAAKIARAVFAELDADVECFVVLALNARGRVTGYKLVSQGTATACLVHPSQVFKAAILLSAVQIILVHNHPSGDPSPSDEDVTITERMRRAGDLLGIPLVDHLVLGSGDAYRSIGL